MEDSILLLFLVCELELSNLSLDVVELLDKFERFFAPFGFILFSFKELAPGTETYPRAYQTAGLRPHTSAQRQKLARLPQRARLWL